MLVPQQWIKNLWYYCSSGLLYADDLIVIAETEHDLTKNLNERKHNVENRGMRVNMNKTKWRTLEANAEACKMTTWCLW